MFCCSTYLYKDEALGRCGKTHRGRKPSSGKVGCRKSAGLVISRRKVTRSTSVECQLFFGGTPESLHRAAFANFAVAIREGCYILP